MSRNNSAIRKFINKKRGTIYCINPYVWWSNKENDSCRGVDKWKITLDGEFTPRQLIQLGNYVIRRNKEKEVLSEI